MSILRCAWIRDFVADYAKHALNDSAIFVTTDHLCLRLRKVSLAAVHLPTNEWMMECWPSLTAYEFSSGTFVVAPLPVSSQFLDCGPLATVAKRMLSQLRTRSELALPKAAITAIAEQLSNDEAASSEMTRQRLLRNLQSIESSGNEYQQLVNALLSVPQIAKDIADRTQKAVQERLSLTASEKQKIDNLRRQASELEASNKKLEEERANAVKELRIAIKKAFASATKKEIAALGDISLLTALLPGAQVPAETSTTSETLGYTATSPTIPTIAVQFAEKSESTVEQTLEALGVDPKHILVASQVFSSISRSGVLVILEEVTEVGVQLACSLARTGVRVLDVPIGLVQSSIELSWLTGNDVDVLLLQNANLSDLSVYGSNLISHVARRLAGRTKAPLPAIILNGCSGPAAVPWPGDLESLSIRITLASLEQAAMGRQEQGLDRSRTPLQRLLDRALERQADKMELTNDVRDALRHLTLAVTRS